MGSIVKESSLRPKAAWSSGASEEGMGGIVLGQRSSWKGFENAGILACPGVGDCMGGDISYGC
jgi:hypothetical protein